MESSLVTSWQIDGETMERVTDFIFLGSKITEMVTAAMKKMLAPWKKNYDKARQWIKKQKHHFANVSLYSEGCGLPSGHVRL